MNSLSPRHTIARPLLLTLGVVAASSGCFWQQADYTTKMESGFKTYALTKELDGLLGVAYQPPGEFQMLIRPLLPAVPVQVPEDRKDVVMWCQGGTPLVELVVMGSAGNESMNEFRRVALGNLQAKHGGPAPGDFTDQPAPVEEPTLYGGRVTFDACSVQTQRQFVSAPGAAPQPLPCNWLVYFTEEGTQKVMLAFIVPESEYSKIYTGIERCRQSLAIGAKVANAQGGPAPPK